MRGGVPEMERAAHSSTLGAMVATTHMLAAGALALKARSLKHGLAIGVLSHLMLDAVPHRDYRWNALGGLALGVDLAGGALTVGKLSGGSRVVLAGALGGVLPDIMRPAERALHLRLTSRLHDTIHTPSRPPAWSALALQGLTAAGAALLLHTASRAARRRPTRVALRSTRHSLCVATSSSGPSGDLTLLTAWLAVAADIRSAASG